MFWDSHSPTGAAYSRQYASIIFVHSQAQQSVAEASAERASERLGQRIYTEIVPYTRFYLAEDYHQKYTLRQSSVFYQEYARIYPTTDALIQSTAAARLNGYLGYYGAREQILADLPRLGLTQESQAALLQRF